MKKIIFFLLLLVSCSKTEELNIPLKFKDINAHSYWGQIHTESITKIGYPDTIQIPILLDLSIFIDDISELETNKSEFVSSLKLKVWNRYEDLEVLKNNDTIDLTISNLINFDFRNTENLYYTDWAWDGYYQDIDRYRYVSEIENKFYHKWDLRKYPFDKQKIRFTFTSNYDTSYVRLVNSNKFKSYANSYLPNLKDGFTIDTIIFNEEFVKSDIIEPFDTGIYDYQGGVERNEVRSRGVYEVVISREGSWIFIKLFLGSFLSLVLSWFVFLIPTREFDAKAQLSVGAIFGAVGNKYFVDSAIASQVLTTADLINNVSITLVILNVLIMILQKNKMLVNKHIDSPIETMKFSIFLFLFSMFIIYIFS